MVNKIKGKATNALFKNRVKLLMVFIIAKEKNNFKFAKQL